jgi:putative tricarboxylic transport membrane protein
VTEPGRVSLVHPRRSAIAAPVPMIAQATLDRDAEEGLTGHLEHDRGTLLATTALGALMVLGGIVVLLDAASLRDSAGPGIGPAAVPTVVGVLLAAVGLVLGARAGWELRRASPGEPVPRDRYVRLVGMLGLLVSFAFLLPVLGYVVCATLLFVGAALLLGAPRPAIVVAYGWTLAVIVFLLFDKLIGLALPVGPWGF